MHPHTPTPLPPRSPAPQPPSTSQRRWLIPLATTGAILVSLLAIGILPRLNRQAELNANAKSSETTAPTVNVVTPQPANASSELALPGTVQAIQEAIVSARAGGYLQRRLVDIGDRVTAGQLLAEIDTPEVDKDLEQARADLARSQANQAQALADLSKSEANLAQARATLKSRQAQLAQAQTNLELARQTWKRWQTLVQQGAVNQQAADERQSAFNASQATVSAAQSQVEADQGNVTAAQASVTSSRANVTAAQANVNASQAALQRQDVVRSYKNVTAPFDGIITARNVDAGALIEAGNNANNTGTGNSGLFKMAQIDRLRIRVKVPQSLMQSIRLGQTATVQIRELPKRVFTGKVVRTADALDANSNTLLTELELPNPDRALRPGMYAQVAFKLAQSTPLLRIPANTLVVDKAGTRVVMVTANQTIRYQPVQLGRDYGAEVEVLSGLKGNERLITNPTIDLQENAIVHSVPVKPAQKP